jgi:tetratricopeptide (TPR) repeat protein
MQQTSSTRAEPLPEALRQAIARVRATPENDARWDELDEAARDADRPDEVSLLYRQIIADNHDPDLLLRIGQRAVAFHEEWYEDSIHAIEILQRLSVVEPGGDWAFERLTLLLTMAERWDDLLAEYDRKLQSTTDADRRLPLLDEAARIAKDFAGQGERASDYLKERLLSKPDDDQLASALERRLERQHRHQDLIEIWGARLGTLSSEEALATRVQIADRQLNELGDASAALNVAEEIAALAGGEEEACRILEQIASRENADVTARRRALAFLRERYAAAGRGPDVIRILALALSVAVDDAQRRELHDASATWLSEGGRHEEALEHAASLFALSPESIEVHSQLRHLAERTGRQDRYAAALVAAARLCPIDERRIDILVEAGKVTEAGIDDKPAAIELYMSVLDDPRAGDSPRLLVARRLRQLLGETDERKRLLGVLERLASLEPSLRGQRQVLGEAAKLADQLGDVDRSLSLWQRCLEASEGDLTALDARIAILERAQRWGALIEDLERRAEAASAPAARRNDLVSVARIYETKLFQLENAIDVWRAIERKFGSNAETVDALVDLCAAANRVNDVIELLLGAIESETDSHRRTDHLARLGDVYREHEKAPARAIEYYKEALAESALHEGARSGLRALLGAGEHGRAAVETLAAALTRSDEWPGVLELVELRVRASDRPAHTRAVLLEAAVILEQRAQDPSGALTYLCRAFELDPSAELEAEVKRLARVSGEWSIAVTGYQRAIERSTDTERVRQLRYQRGQILEDRIEDREAALASYRQITIIDPSHRDAACAAARVATKLRAWNELAAVFVENSVALGQVDRKVASAIETATVAAHAWENVTQSVMEALEGAGELAPRVAHDLRRELGVWFRDYRSDPKTSEALLAAAVTSQPEPDTLRMLAELRRREPGRPLVETLLLLADATPDDLGVLYEAASVALHTVGDPDLAQPILERARRIAGSELERLSEDGKGSVGSEADRVAWWSIEELVKLAISRAHYNEALGLLVEGAALPFDAERCIGLSYRAALVAVENLSDEELGAKICRGILQRAPAHAGAIALLGSIYETSESYRELLELRQKELALAPPLERRLLLRLDEARILALLGDPGSERVRALRQNVDERPGHIASIDELTRILSESGEHAALFELLISQARKVAQAGDSAHAAMLFARAGALSEGPLQNAAQALGAYQASVELAPTPPVLDALARLSSQKGQHVAAVGWLEQRLSLTAEDDLLARRTTLLELASALRASGAEERARGYLREGLERDPAAALLRSLLADSYRSQGDYERLAPLLTEGVDHTDDTARKVEYLRDAARVRRVELDQLELSIPLLERAVALDGKDRDLKLSLADAYRHAARHDEARQLLTLLLEEFGRRRTPERAQVHFQLAQIARATGDLDVALEQLDLASKVDRDNIEMLELLGEVAREKGQLEEAERAYRTLLLLLGRSRPNENRSSIRPANDRSSMRPANDRSLSQGSAGAGTSKPRAHIGESSILFELYRIASQLGQTERAKDLLDSALEAGAHDGEEAARLEQALREAGDHDLLLRALSQRLAHTKEPIAVSAVLASRSDVLVSLGRHADALEDRLAALNKNPSATELVPAAWELGARVGKSDRVAQDVSALAERVVGENPRLACEMWLVLGGLCEAGGDTVSAARHYLRAQSTGQRPLECLEAVERAGVGGDPDALARALESFIENADPDVAPERYTEVLYRLGTLDLYQSRPSEAVQHIDVALARDGDSRRVLELLRSALSVNTPTHEVVALLERVARDANDRGALLVALIHEARLGSANLADLREAVELAREARDAATEKNLLLAAVKLAEDTGQMGDAIWAVDALATVFEQSGDARAAADLLGRSVPHAQSDDAFELRLRLAGLAQGELGELELAATVYESLLEEEPTNVRVWRPLFDVYRRKNDSRKLEERISAIEKAVDDPALRHSLRIERMRILIDADRKAEAESALKALLDEEPSSTEASELLEQLLEGQGRLSELHSLIEQRLISARERGDKAGVTSGTIRLGKILSATDRDAALEVYRGSLALGGDNRELLEAFLELCDSERHAEDRARGLYQLLALESGQTAVLRTLELVGLHKAQDDFAGVERALDRGLSRAPESEALHAERVQWYRQHNAWDKLAQALCDHAAQLDSSQLKKEQIEQAALIYERELGDPRRAAETLERATDPALPDPELLAKIAQLWLGANEPNRALSHLTHAIDLYTTEDAELGALFHLRGRLRLELDPSSLDNLNLALEDLSRAAQLNPERARRDLARALTEKLALLEARPEEESRAQRGKTTLELGRVLGALDQVDAAVALINGWVAQNPDDKAAQLELGNLAAQRDDWATAADAYRGLVPLTSGEEQLGVVSKLAEACEKLGDPLAAKDALELVHAQFPGEESVRKRLRKMYQAAKAYKGWASMLVAEAQGTADKRQKFELLCNAGDLYRQAEEGALEEARAAYADALALEDDAKIIVKLVDVEVQLEHIEEAASRLDEAIRSHGKRRSPELSLLQHAMAKVATAAGDEEAVFAWLEAALYSDRQNGAVASELAALAMSRGEFDVAIKALQLVTLLKTPGPMSRAEAYLRQAAIAKHRGDVKKSALLAKRALTTEPDYQEAKVFLEELQVRESMIPEA